MNSSSCNSCKVILLASVICVASSTRIYAEPPKRNPTQAEMKVLSAANNRLNTLLHNKDWKEAEKCCLELLESLKPFTDDDSVTMCLERVKLARAYQGQGRLTQARRELEKDVDRLEKYDTIKHPDIDPIDYPQALYILAEIEFELLNHDSSIRKLERLLKLLTSTDREKSISKLRPQELIAMSRKYRGLIRAGQSDFVLAREDFSIALKEAMSLEPSQPIFVATLRQCVSACWLAEAEESLDSGRKQEATVHVAKAEAELLGAEEFCRTTKNPSAQAAHFIKHVEYTRTTLEMMKARANGSPTLTSLSLGGSCFLLPSSSRAFTETKALQLMAAACKQVANGRPAEADPDMTRAMDLLRSESTVNDRILVLCKFNQAILRSEFLNRLDEGVRQAEDALDLLYAVNLKDLAFQSLRQQQVMLTSSESALRTYLSLAIKANRPANEIYTHILHWKGLLFTLYSKKHEDSETWSQTVKLLAATVDARTRYASCIESEKTKPEEKLRAREYMDEMDRNYAEFITAKYINQKRDDDSPSKLSSRLTPGTVLVDYAMYWELARAGENPSPHPSPLRYVAFILKSGEQDVKMVLLPEHAEKLNQQILHWRELLLTAETNGCLPSQ